MTAVDKEDLLRWMTEAQSKPRPLDPHHSQLRSPQHSSPTLVLPLPSMSLLDKEAYQLSLWEAESQQARRHSELEAIALSAGPVAEVRSPRKVLQGLLGKARVSAATPGKRQGTFELHSVYKAIDDRDVMKLMEIRDSPNGFDLLLRKPGTGTWPLVYAMRCGPQYSEVTIVLVGAFSRYVNQLEGDDVPLTKEQVAVVKALRINLKAAIDFGLASQQTQLLSSYLQVLVMSEGESFINKCVQDLTLALRAGPPCKPVGQAKSAVERFYTKDLRGKDKTLAAVEDYIANATADLILFALHDLLISPGDEPLPLFSFARDLRTLNNFEESLRTHLPRKPPRIRKLAQLCIDVIGNTRHSFPTRIKELADAIDGESSP